MAGELFNNINNTVSRVDATYTREVELKPEKHMVFFIVLAVITVGIFLIFGIRPNLISITRKVKYVSELRDLRDAMRTKTEQLDTAESDLQTARPYLPLLDNALPNQSQIQNYLKDLVLVASENNFVLQDLRAYPLSNTEIELNLKMLGNINNLSKFVSQVEQLGRTTTIDRIDVDVRTFETNFKITGTIYKLDTTGEVEDLLYSF